jgi:hypothetical protein
MKKTFACAVDWPGWSRSGRDEESALQALLNYGARYATILHALQIKLHLPSETSEFKVIERLKGDATTDFGAPSAVPEFDLEPVNEAELERFQALLQACWQAFDTAVDAAAGKELRKGQRGGGRELKKIVQHVLESEAGYLSSLGWKHKVGEGQDLSDELRRARSATLEGLTRAAHGELPEIGPRGGRRWKPRQFVRRAGWHVLDHAWEIEERVC